MEYSYPQFRKNTSGKSFYQITSDRHLVEWQQLGSILMRHEMNASILPEKLLIADLLACTDGHYEIISEREFKLATEQC
jgi:hypothetical protein